MSPPAPSLRRELAIALVSAAVILLQITLTRILSVLLWYHWAFFVISLAMLGLGAPGVWLSIVKRRERFLVPALLASAVLIPAGVITVIQTSRPGGATSITWAFVELLPAALALGTAVCILLLDVPGRGIGRMYAADLGGACAGAILVIPLLGLVPTPELAGAIGLLPLAAAFVVGGRRSRIAVAILATLLLAAVGWREPFRIRSTKSYAEIGRRVPIWEQWTPTARLTVFDHVFWRPVPEAPFAWGSGTVRPAAEPLEQYWLEQDGAAGTPITRFDGDLSRLTYLLHDVTTVGYQLRPPRRVAVVGAGGGRDLLSAKLSGAEEIDAIELNAAIIAALRGRFGEFSGHVYDLDGVRAIAGEGRSVLTRSQGGYDLLQISLTDSWAATAAGAFSLSENHLYTIEAFRLYWSRLSPGGLLSVSRWMVGGFGMELPRLLFLAQAALSAEGVAAASDHLAVFQGGEVATLLVSKLPFTGDETTRMLAIARERGFHVHIPVSDLAPEERVVARLAAAGHRAFEGSGLRVEPPTDDRPFFFQVLSPFAMPDAASRERGGVNAQSVVVLRRLMVVVSAVAVAFFFLPFPLRLGFAGGRDFWAGNLFFAAIGISFMLVEVAWVQRFILYLGHPSRAATVALGALLLGAGLGSRAAVGFDLGRARRLGFVPPAGLALLNAALGPLLPATLGWPLAARFALSAALLVPAGFLMGFFFPLGMVRFGEESRAWLWAMNGAAGVVASVVSLALAMEFGFARVALVGIAVYVVAWGLFAIPSAPPLRSR